MEHRVVRSHVVGCDLVDDGVSHVSVEAFHITVCVVCLKRRVERVSAQPQISGLKDLGQVASLRGGRVCCSCVSRCVISKCDSSVEPSAVNGVVLSGGDNSADSDIQSSLKLSGVLTDG